MTINYVIQACSKNTRLDAHACNLNLKYKTMRQGMAHIALKIHHTPPASDDKKWKENQQNVILPYVAYLFIICVYNTYI